MAVLYLSDLPIFGNTLTQENRGITHAHNLPQAHHDVFAPLRRKYRRCHCPIWADGFIGREEIRETLKTRSWEEAQQKIREWEAERSKPQEPTDNRITVEAACERYLADGRARQLGTAAIYKYSLLTRQIKAFAIERGVRFLEELDLDLLRDFRATWKNRNLSAKKKLQQLKGFFRFCGKGGALSRTPLLT